MSNVLAGFPSFGDLPMEYRGSTEQGSSTQVHDVDDLYLFCNCAIINLYLTST